MKTLLFIILLVFLYAAASFSHDYFVIENSVRCQQTQDPVPYVSPFSKTQNVDALVLLKKSLERIKGNYHPGFQNYVGRYQFVTTDEISADTVRHSIGKTNVCLPSLVCSRDEKVYYDSLVSDVDHREESLSKYIDSEEERTMFMPFPYDLKYMLVYFSYMSIEYRHIDEAVTPTNQDETPRINKRLMRRFERYIKKIGAPELLNELEERY